MRTAEAPITQTAINAFQRQEKVKNTMLEWKLNRIFGMALAHINGLKAQIGTEIRNVMRGHGINVDSLDMWALEQIAKNDPVIGQHVADALWPMVDRALHDPAEKAHP